MDLSRLSSKLNERQVLPEEAEPVLSFRTAVRKYKDDPQNAAWWKPPLLNRPFTREGVRDGKYKAKTFMTVTPVILEGEQLERQNALMRRLHEQDLKQRLDKIENPLQKAWQRFQDQFNGEAY